MYGKYINMSRIGKQPINIPENVEVKLEDNKIIVKGPKGTLEQELRKEVEVEIKDDFIKLTPVQKTKSSITPALWGLYRALIANMVKGVLVGFEKKLEIIGIGYKVALQGEDIVLKLGFSHPVNLKVPSGIEINIEKNIITVSGIDKQLVGQFAADIRAKKPPEPYKGKGIRYVDEVVRRKPGKKAATIEK